MSEPVESCTIITTEANSIMKPIHERMPVILKDDCFDKWLDPGNSDKECLQEMLKPCDSEMIEMYPISTAVNSPRNNSPELLNQIDVLN